MNKGIRIGALVVVCALIAGLLGYAVSSKQSSDRQSTTAQATTQAMTTVVAATVQATTQQTTTQATTQPTTQATTGESATTQQAQAQQLIGKWTDGAGMSGYEFFDNGKVTVTYVNVTVPVVNIPVNGSYNGTYKLDGDRVTVSFSIYSAAITYTYIYSVDNTQLTLINVEDNTKTIYMKAAEQSTQPDRTAVTTATTSQTQTTSQQDGISGNDEIIGEWVDNEKTVQYTFKEDSTFTREYLNENKKISGVYIFDGSILTMQYKNESGSTVVKLKCTASKNSMTIVDEASNEQTVLVRDGTGNGNTSNMNALIGKWMDGASMSGYEFFNDGVVTVTYVNFTVPVVNIPINGTYNGSYTVSGDTVNISFSVYGRVIRNSYKFSVEGDSLTLIDTEDGNTATYIKN